MNIFSLATTPQESARAHCDQHLHKMILESAQMVSTALHSREWFSPWLYRPAYQKHPCTIWAAQSNHNILWLCELAKELAVIRDELGCAPHSSSDVIKAAVDILGEEVPYASWTAASPRIFCGPVYIAYTRRTIEEKYREYYRHKNKLWNNTMSWRNRPIPSFMEQS